MASGEFRNLANKSMMKRFFVKLLYSFLRLKAVNYFLGKSLS